MGKNVSIEDELLAAIAPGRSIGLELALSAYLKISKLQSRVDELTKAKGELLQKLAKAENRYELLEAHNQEQEQKEAAYSEDVKTLLEKGVFEVVPEKPIERCSGTVLSASEPKVTVPRLVPDALINPNDMGLMSIYAIYRELLFNGSDPSIRFDSDLAASSCEFEWLRKNSSTGHKLWFVEFQVPKSWDSHRRKKHVKAMERQAKAYTSYVNGLIEGEKAVVPPIKPQKVDAVAAEESKPETNRTQFDVMLNGEQFNNLFTAVNFLSDALGREHPVIKFLGKYKFHRVM